MNASTFPRAAALVLLVLGGCATETAPADPNAPDPANWRLLSGKEPTSAEFTALEATCRDRQEAFDDCLVRLGLKRAK
ncbi:MAG TPA: hypothetical protein VGR70_14040 [Stellaceae bacterium]|nr:hypothetical protein [Stellaceae bacterium]